MFALRFAIVALLALTISGQSYDGGKPAVNGEKGYPFGKLRLSEDGKKEELVLVTPSAQTQLKQDQKQHIQPLPSPCIGTRPLTRLAHPGDKTKYIFCRDEFHYEIFSCPNNGEYNYQIGACEATVPVLDRCAEEKPCLNDGQCSMLSNSTFKCACRQDWTGERCETPLNSCVQKPCGPNAECRILKTADYDQDYICVCNAKKGYGFNCDETVPNPCLKSSEQFFPFAYSQRAYLQCDGEVVYFQPCGPSLYWNQEEKVCDRKRPPKLDLSTLLKTYGVTEEELEPSTTTTTTTTTTPRTVQEDKIPFIPARIADRQQGFYGQNLQNTQWSQPQQNQQFGSQQWLNQVPNSNMQNEQRFVPQQQAYQNYRFVSMTTTPASVTVPSWQDQQPEVETTTPITTTIPSWQQTRPMNQWSGYQTPQSWQNFRIVTTTTTTTPAPQQFQDQNQQPEIETTTPITTTIPSWQQTRPMNQWNGYQVPQSWQNLRVITTTTTPAPQQFQDQNQQPEVETTTTTTPITTTIPSWQQTRPMNQWSGYQVPQTQSWQNFRVVTTTTTPAPELFQDQNQQPEVETTTTTTPITTTIPSWQQTRPMNQWNGYQIPQSWQNLRVVTTTTTPASVIVPSWQNQQQFQDQNQQPVVETTTPITTTIPSWLQPRPMNQWNGFQVPSQNQYQQSSWETTTPLSNVVPSSIQTSEQSWQVKPTNQLNPSQVSPTIGFQPHQPSNIISSSQSRLNTKTFSTLQPILPITTTTTTTPQSIVSPSAQNQWNNNQFSQSVGLTQQQGVAPIQKVLDQTPTWMSNQQIPSQWSQPAAAPVNNVRYQNLAAPTRSWPQNNNMDDQPKKIESGSWGYNS